VKVIALNVELFRQLDTKYRSANGTAGGALVAANLMHLSKGDAKGVNISSSFPLLSEIVAWFSIVGNDSAFQKYFQYDLTPQQAQVRAAAVRVAIVIVENYIRSSVLFSQKTTD